MLGTASGTALGTSFGGVNLPLNVDGLTLQGVSGFNQAPYSNSLGTTDARGFADASLTLPPLAILQGLTLHHAYALLSGPNVLATSNPVALQLN